MADNSTFPALASGTKRHGKTEEKIDGQCKRGLTASE